MIENIREFDGKQLREGGWQLIEKKDLDNMAASLTEYTKDKES